MLFDFGIQLDLGTGGFETETAEIPGLTYIPEYMPADEQRQLLDLIDQKPWSGELKRRVQHYGYKYDYKKRAVSLQYLGELPAWAKKLAGRLHQEGLPPQIPDQLIVNEYKPGQGIARHIDCVPCFGDTILSLSLGSACVMNFTHIPAGTKTALLLQPGSLLILQGEARYQWQHGIAPRQRDKYRGAEFARTRRVSLTFRTVLKS